jgi:uncharacterized membrane protein (DUF441 family)
MLNNFFTSLVRTYVPLVVAFVATWAAKHGLNFDSNNAALILGTAVAGAYYAAVRWLEAKFPQFGWLLGTPATPTYAKK